MKMLESNGCNANLKELITKDYICYDLKIDFSSDYTKHCGICLDTLPLMMNSELNRKCLINHKFPANILLNKQPKIINKEWQLKYKKNEEKQKYNLDLDNGLQMQLKRKIINSEDIDKVLLSVLYSKILGGDAEKIIDFKQKVLIEDPKKFLIEEIQENSAKSIRDIKEIANPIEIAHQLLLILYSFERNGLALLKINSKTIKWDDKLKQVKIGCFDRITLKDKAISTYQKEKKTIYDPPEIWENKEVKPEKVDVFSFGILLFKLLVNEKETNIHKIRLSTQNEYHQFKNYVQRILALYHQEKWGNCIDMCIDIDPEKRPKFTKIMEFFEGSLAEKANEANINNHSIKENISLFTQLGLSYYNKGKYQQAYMFYLKGIQLIHIYYGKEHPIQIQLLLNISAVFDKLNQHKKSLYVLYEVKNILLNIRKKDLVEINNLLALQNEQIGNYHQAINYYLMVEDYFLINAGKYEEISGNYNNLALFYQKTNNNKKFIEYKKKIKRLKKKIFGNQHMEHVVAYYSLGEDYENMGHYYNALKYYCKAEEVLSKLPQINTLDLLGFTKYIAFLSDYVGLYKRACVYYDKIADLTSRLNGDVSLPLAEIYISSGKSCVNACNYESAAGYYFSASFIFARMYGERNARYLETVVAIGEASFNSNDYDQAMEYYEKAKNIVIQLYGHKSLEFGSFALKLL